AALVLRRGGSGLARVEEVTLGHGASGSPTFDGIEGLVGHAGAATGLASVYRACLALSHDVLPSPGGSRYWLSSERRAVLGSEGADGSFAGVALGETTAPERSPLVVPRREGFFAVEGGSPAELLAGLTDLEAWLDPRPETTIDALTREWLRTRWRPS